MSEQEGKRERETEMRRGGRGSVILKIEQHEKAAAPLYDPCNASNVSHLNFDYSWSECV